MSLFKAIQSIFEGRAITSLPSSYSDSTEIDLGGREGLTARRVAGYPAVSQALQMISGDCAKLPLQVYQVNGETRSKVSHPIDRLVGLFGSPNETDTTYDLLFDWFFHCLLFGKSALLIDRVGPDPVGLIPLLPDRTTPVYYRGKRYFATEYRDDENKPQVEYLPNDDVLYLEFLNLDKLNPQSPIKLYQETFKQAINAQDFTASYFEGGTQQGGILMTPPGAGPTAIDNVEKQVEAKRSDRSKWFKTLILKDGFRWQSTTSSLKDSVAVELDESTARQVARCYNLPPSKIGLQDSVAHASLFDQNRQYLDSCLSHWLTQSKGQMNRKLLLPSEQGRLQVDYDVDAIQWLDPETKAKIAMLGVQWGFIRPETASKWFGEKPLTLEELQQIKSIQAKAMAQGVV